MESFFVAADILCVDEPEMNVNELINLQKNEMDEWNELKWLTQEFFFFNNGNKPYFA